MNKKYSILIIIATLLTACADKMNWGSGSTPDANGTEGEAVVFTTALWGAPLTTKAAFGSQDEMTTELAHYSPVSAAYELKVEMFKQGDNPADSLSLGSAIFVPTPNEESYVSDGTLSLKAAEGNTPLYWPDNVNKYGFKLTAGSATVAANQSDPDVFLLQDKLLGFGFAPAFDEQASPKTDDLYKMNYHTNKEWFAANQRYFPALETNEYKKIPLFVRHERAWVTIILKAGKGVNAEDLRNPAAIIGTVYSMPEGADMVEVNQMLKRTIEVDADDDSSTKVTTTQLDAIIEPYNFLEHVDQNLFRVALGTGTGGVGLNFTYKASNDVHYQSYTTKDKTNLTDPDVQAMQAYNLTAGKHLTLTATLTTDRLILMTARLEDWDELSMMTVCDDYGENGDPILIDSRWRLLKFLSNPDENKAGNTALIQSTSLDLDSITPGGVHVYWNNETKYDLNCTLNLAGAVLRTDAQFVKDITVGGTIVNGTIEVTGENPGETAICTKNYGMLHQVAVTVKDGLRQTAAASRAGMAVVNYGTIYKCSSDLKVENKDTTVPTTENPRYLGGIAAESRYAVSTAPKIDQCIVNNKVGTNHDEDEETNGKHSETYGQTVTGVGGIVGYAEGFVTNCVNNNGMTLIQQTHTKYKNIVAATTTTDKIVSADDNWWPTTAQNQIGRDNNPNANTAAKYEGVISSQGELAFLLKYYSSGSGNTDDPYAYYRIANDFTVDESWDFGKPEVPNTDWNANQKEYNLKFNLDGNHHTITTSGKMLFSHINGRFYDLNIYCSQSLITAESRSSEESVKNRLDVMAPLAYSVNGEYAKLENIQVRMADATFIKAATPAGLVVWAYDRASIVGCEVRVDLRAVLTGLGLNDATRYTGAIAAMCSEATFDRCIVHSGTSILEYNVNGTLETTNKHTRLYQGGIVGGVTRKSEAGTETPNTLITDCISWWGIDPDGNGNYTTYQGSIIGNPEWTTNTQTISGMNAACAGNWWSNGKPVGTKGAHRNDYEKFVGYKNNVGPEQDNF